MQYTQEELNEILERHEHWINEDIDGWRSMRADLRWADLRWANLRGADLRWANLRGADLRGANLYGADLRWADLRWANLYGADLYGANLRGADLRGANLYGADLYGANLRGADNIDLALAQTEIVPREGAFIGWKKCRYGAIVKLRIPEGAKRSCATGRKCRASFADVLEIWDADGNRLDVAYSFFSKDFEYRAGCRVRPETWEKNRLLECGGGIHFFLTREEAQAFSW